MRAPVVIAINYHRIGTIEPANPLHRLHTVSSDVFDAQLDAMRELGPVITLAQARNPRDLAEINFVVCFDDVPVSALDAINPMLEHGLPVTVSVCAQLAERGYGTRDLVYSIEKFASPESIERHLRNHLPNLDPGPLSFYHLTKSAVLDPHWIRQELIYPLFADIETSARPYLRQRGYLSWQQLRGLSRNRLVTLANHTIEHDNLEALPRSAVHHRIRNSHALIATELGTEPRYFTVPFGALSQRLAQDCLEPLSELDYHGILWVGASGTTVLGTYHHQPLQLTRLHAATTLDNFVRQVRIARQTAAAAVIWQLPATVRRGPVVITENRDPRRSCRTEMLLRQGKDYASDPAFYRYQFGDNPYRGERCDYYAVEYDERIEAIAYNFHTAFAIDGITVPGVYLSSWRRLPHTHPAAAGRLLHTMLAREPLVGVYDPNPAVHHAFAGWLVAHVHRLTLPVAAKASSTLATSYSVVESAHYPSAMASLCDASLHRAGFTVTRDKKYHQWRHTNYPLGTATYLALHRNQQPAGLAVALRTATTLAVVDFHLRQECDAPALIQASLNHAARHSASEVLWETSSTNLATLAANHFGATMKIFRNFYHANTARLSALGVNGLLQRWDQLPLHETGTTGDVLPR